MTQFSILFDFEQYPPGNQPMYGYSQNMYPQHYQPPGAFGYSPNAAPQVSPTSENYSPGNSQKPIYGNSQNIYRQNAPPPMNYYGKLLLVQTNNICLFITNHGYNCSN